MTKMKAAKESSRNLCVSACVRTNAVIVLALALYFLIVPGLTVLIDLRDPALKSEKIPNSAFRLHRSVTPRYERWARQRVKRGAAAELNQLDVSGTEWPLFGSVFYLWATESLQDEWQRDHGVSSEEPAVYARGAVDAAAALVADPVHATWVRKYWGPDYLHTENVFYRALLIGGLTSHYKLTGDPQYLPLLRDQVVTLSHDLDQSPHGVLDDYPGECYPTDVITAIAVIRRADAILGTDHSEFTRRAIRGFRGKLLDSRGLPPYAADSKSGEIVPPSRGCGDSFLLTWVPELWPDTAKDWYSKYEEYFWQRNWLADGFREFPKDVGGGDWYMDVDAGPVLAGHGFAACAFGVGAARANGRFDHAYSLSTEMLAISWPLPDGTLLLPRILSNAVDAPYLGEVGILFCLTRSPVTDDQTQTKTVMPPFVYLLIGLYFVPGLLIVWASIGRLRSLGGGKGDFSNHYPYPNIQCVAWIILILVALVQIIIGNLPEALLAIFVALLLPHRRKVRLPEEEPVAEQVD